MDMKTNPHTQQQPWGNVVFWRGNSACGVNDDWTHAEVNTPPSYHTGMKFTADQKGDMQRLLHMLDIAFERGRQAKVREFLKVMEL